MKDYRPPPHLQGGLPISHYFVDPETGKTYRELNEEIKHGIPVGALVEVVEAEDMSGAGVRLHVTAHRRDCDGTPLYSLGMIDGEDGSVREWIHGYPEDCLKVIG